MSIALKKKHWHMALLLNFRLFFFSFFSTLFLHRSQSTNNSFDIVVIVVVVVASNKCWHWCFQFTKFISTWFTLCLFSIGLIVYTTQLPLCLVYLSCELSIWICVCNRTVSDKKANIYTIKMDRMLVIVGNNASTMFYSNRNCFEHIHSLSSSMVFSCERVY